MLVCSFITRCSRDVRCRPLRHDDVVCLFVVTIDECHACQGVMRNIADIDCLRSSIEFFRNPNLVWILEPSKDHLDQC